MTAFRRSNSNSEYHQTTHSLTTEDGIHENNYRRSLAEIFKTLRQEALCYVESYVVQEKCDEESEWHQSSTGYQIYSTFCHLYDHLENMEGSIFELLDLAPHYDFRDCQANGYRSLVRVVQSCLTHLMALVRYISVNKNSYNFRLSHYVKQLDSYTMTLGQLRDVLRYTRKLMDYSPLGQLMPSETLLDSAVADKIQMEMDMIDQECFYGHSLGFQVTLKVLILCLCKIIEG